MTAAVYLLLPFFTAVFLIPLCIKLMIKRGHMQVNYCGQPVPQSMGIIFIPVFAVAAAWGRLTGLLPAKDTAGVLIITMGFGFLGLIDDCDDNQETKGFSGHLLSLIREGRVTTGLLKAVFGFLLSLAAAYVLTGRPMASFYRAFIIALSANFLNLLDLRPGRALKGFFLLALIIIFLQPGEAAVLLFLPFLLSGLAVFPRDLAGTAMLGDTGANILGGVSGFIIAACAPPVPRLAYFMLLLTAHVLAEKLSFSQLIESCPPLSFLDRLGRGDLQKSNGRRKKIPTGE